MAPASTNAVVWQAAGVPTEGNAGKVTLAWSASGVLSCRFAALAGVSLDGSGIGVESVKALPEQASSTWLAMTDGCSWYGTLKKTPELKLEKSGSTAVRIVATLALPPEMAPSSPEMAEKGTPPPRPHAERWPQAKTLLAQSGLVGSLSKSVGLTQLVVLPPLQIGQPPAAPRPS